MIPITSSELLDDAVTLLDVLVDNNESDRLRGFAAHALAILRQLPDPDPLGPGSKAHAAISWIRRAAGEIRREAVARESKEAARNLEAGADYAVGLLDPDLSDPPPVSGPAMETDDEPKRRPPGR